MSLQNILSVNTMGGEDPNSIDFQDEVILQHHDTPVTVRQLLENPQNFFDGELSRDDIFVRLRLKSKLQGHATIFSESVYDFLIEKNSPYLTEDKFNADELPSPLQIKRWIKKEYDLKIEIIRKGQYISEDSRYYTEPYEKSPEELAFDLFQIKNDIQKLPPRFFHSLGITSLYFCGSIINKDLDHFAGLMFNTNKGQSFYLSQTFPFHHELFHRIDYLSGGGSLISTSSLKNNDEWSEQDPDYQQVYKQKKCNYDEEQAEYARILLNLDDPKVYRYQYLPLTEYEGGRAKLQQMKKWFYQSSNGLMNDQYWIDLQEGKIDENYWKSPSK